LRNLEAQCNGAKQKRQAYLNYSKKVSNDEKRYNEYLLRAEQVDMSYCATLKESRHRIESFQPRN